MALSREEVAQKAKDKTLTVGEAIEYAKTQDMSSSRARQINALPKNFKDKGIPLDTPYYQLRSSSVAEAFDARKEGVANSWRNFYSMEEVLNSVFMEYGIRSIVENDVALYPVLSGSGNYIETVYKIPATMRSGLAGERPMQGIVTLEQLAEIYREAIPKIEDEEIKAALAYNVATAVRPAQLVGPNAIKKSDVVFNKDESDTIVSITIKEKRQTVAQQRSGADPDRKNRPEVTFPIDSEIGQVVYNQYERSETDNLFGNVTSARLSSAFNKNISPTLLSKYKDELPLLDSNNPDKGVVSTISAIRHIVPKAWIKTKGVPRDVVEYMMGHISGDILEKNYIGQDAGSASQIVASAMNEYALEGPKRDFADSPLVTGEFRVAGSEQQGSGGVSFGTIQLTDEQKATIAAERISESELKEAENRQAIRQINTQEFEYWSSEEGQFELENLATIAVAQEEAQVAAEEARQEVRDKAAARKQLQRELEAQEKRKLSTEAQNVLLDAARSLGIQVDEDEENAGDAITSMGEILERNFELDDPKLLTQEAEAERSEEKPKKPFGSTVLDPLGSFIKKASPYVRGLEIGQYAIEKGPELLQSAMESETAQNLGETLMEPYQIDESSTDEDVLNAMQDFAARTKGYR